jgi:hypothetical protein
MTNAARQRYYYHASNQQFEPGDTLTPRGSDEGMMHRRDAVYLSDKPSTSERWSYWLADMHEKPCHVYRVTAPPTPTKHWAKDVDDYEFHAPEAIVVKKMVTHHPGEWDA